MLQVLRSVRFGSCWEASAHFCQASRTRDGSSSQRTTASALHRNSDVRPTRQLLGSCNYNSVIPGNVAVYCCAQLQLAALPCERLQAMPRLALQQLLPAS